MMAPGFIFMPELTSWLGAEGSLLENSVLYGRIFILALPAWILSYAFQLSLSLLKNRGWGFWSRYSQECVI